MSDVCLPVTRRCIQTAKWIVLFSARRLETCTNVTIVVVVRPHRSTTYVDAACVNDRVAWSVCQSVCLSHSQPCKNSSTDRDAVSVEDSGGPKAACVRWGAHWRYLANTTESSVCRGDAAFLWPPCVADADIIFSSCGFFFFFLAIFFPRLFSAVAYWMSTNL